MGNRHSSLGLWLVSVATALALAGCVTVNPTLVYDTDGDGVPDAEDICPGFDDSADTDADGVPDGCDPCPLDNPDDTDGDGVCDSDDPCPLDNPDDTDTDGVCDSDDICPGFDDGIDTDGDGTPDGCEAAVIDFDWPEGVPDLGAWLEAHPTVAGALVWEGDVLNPPPPSRCGYASAGPFCGAVMDWPWRDAAAQADLFDAFVKAWLGAPSGVSDAPPNAADTSDSDKYGHQEYSPEDGMAVFMAYAANSLAVEIGNHHVERPSHMAEVGWSILGDEYTVAPESGFHVGVTPLAVLFDSRKFFYRQPDGNLKVSMVAHGGMTTMSAPETATAFLQGASLPYTDLEAYNCRAETFDCSASLPLLVAAAAPTETIARTLHWFRFNPIHFSNHWWYGNMDAHWQYRGYTPAVRIMTGTVRTEYISESGDRRNTSADTRTIPRTAGCWGTTGFMRSVLRSVNIPVVLETAGGHALPSFPTEANLGRPSHMSHGDDPYSMLVKTSPHPSHALLMDKALWKSWFFPPPEPGEPEPELVEPTNEVIEDGFLDDLPGDLDYCGGDPDCGYAPPPEPEPDQTGAAIENTPKRNVGRRGRELALSWTSRYVTNKYCGVLELQVSEPGTPVEGSEISLRNHSAEDLSSLDCSELPDTGDLGASLGLFCREDFFGYMAEIIDAEGGCSEVRARQTYEETVAMP